MGMQDIQSQDELVCDSGNNHPSVNSTNISFIWFPSSQSGQVWPIPWKFRGF
jgi:hypothetical protein